MGVGGCLFPGIPNLSCTWVCSLSFQSLNAPFENRLTDWGAALCIQTQTCGQSDIKKYVFWIWNRAETDTGMCSTCNKKKQKEMEALQYRSMFNGYTSLQCSQEGYLIKPSQVCSPAINPSCQMINPENGVRQKIRMPCVVFRSIKWVE